MAIINGAMLLIMYGSLLIEEIKSLQIGSLFHAADIILFSIAIHRIHPVAFAFYQLISLVNLKNPNRIAKFVSMLFGLAALAVFPLGVKPLDVVIVVASCLTATEIHRTNKRQPSHLEQHQIEFFASLISAVVLALVVPDPLHSFVGVLKEKVPNIFLVMLGVIGGLAFYGHRKTDIDDTRSSLVSFFVLSVVSSAIFLDRQHLALALAAICVASMAAYLSLQKYDQVIIDVESASHSKSTKSKPDSSPYETVKIIAVVGLTLFLMTSHLDTFNPDMTYAVKMLSTTNPRHLKEMITVENTTTTDVLDQDFNQYTDPNMPEGVRKQLRMQCLHKTRDVIKDLLLPYFRPGKAFTLMDYPNYWNLGDSFIYAGTEQLFRVYGQMANRIAFPYDKYAALRKANVTDGVIFMQGGGNFGDLYGFHQTLRLNVVGYMPNTDIVFLPQSIHYKKATNVKNHKLTFEKHKNLTMAFRDYDSLNFAVTQFPLAKSIFVPDMAFMLGPLLPNSDPVVDILFLIRVDVESVVPNRNLATQFANEQSLSSELWDFPIDGFPTRQAKSGATLWDYGKMLPGRLLTDQTLSPDGMYNYRTQLGNTLLSRGRIVITDRLHASIMSTLIDRPVIYIDNSYKKLTRIRRGLEKAVPECSDVVLNARYAESLEQAVSMAGNMLKEVNMKTKPKDL
eukprot:TRINITY_DN2867_c0_g1_i1.p1 TRINITY_DN2867_c0_g1~~TRINITY_DN2867_c0_g1_i1.p1  ORF type:complete len:726 (+),score=97.18 TRINITY_DN2867_c0_g1_i1:142-2178(+)